jgi:hypothetical protein
MVRDNTIIIPGHGGVLAPADLARFRAGIATIWDQADWAYNQGIALTDVYDHESLEWPWDRECVTTGLGLAYAEMAVREQSAREAAARFDAGSAA